VSSDFSSLDSFPVLTYRNSLMNNPPLPRPFGGDLIFHLDDNLGIWFARTEDYLVSRRELSGDTTLVFTIPFEPEEVTPEERAHATTTWLPGRRIDPSEVNDVKPVLQGLTTSPDGHVFVFPHLAGTLGGTVVDVFESSGKYLGRVPLPVRLEWRPRPVAVAGFLYGVTKDSVDVPYLVRIRLGPEGG
jgi:hypothetical protein